MTHGRIRSRLGRRRRRHQKTLELVSPKPPPSKPQEDEAEVRSLDLQSEWSPLSSSLDANSQEEDETRSSNRSTSPLASSMEQEDAVVLYTDPPTLQHSFGTWIHHADLLLNSAEMADFVASSRSVVVVASGVAVRTLFLPVTLPVQIISNTTSTVVGTCTHVVQGTTHALFHTFDSPSAGEESSQQGGGLLHHVSQVIPFLWNVAGRVTVNVGSTVVQLVSPSVEQQPRTPSPLPDSHHRTRCAAGESSSEQDSFLDRLRLDYVAPSSDDSCQDGLNTVSEPSFAHPSTADCSKFLLRVNDLDIIHAETSERPICYIDLSKEFRQSDLIAQAIDQLALRGLGLVSSNPYLDPLLDVKGASRLSISWKPEASSRKLMKKKESLSKSEWIELLQMQTCLFSGDFEGCPVYLAQGYVERFTPRDFVQLMWDSDRTEEYNKYSLGRIDSIILEEDVLTPNASLRGAKVVKSETRVPFTNLSFELSALMHVRPLPDGDGYVIVSRSLHSGMAGCHFQNNKVESCNNEILWGVNIARAVPGEPHLVNLMSLSQASSTMLPKFLAHRIGLMGIEDFFSNLRKLASQQ